MKLFKVIISHLSQDLDDFHVIIYQLIKLDIMIKDKLRWIRVETLCFEYVVFRNL